MLKRPSETNSLISATGDAREFRRFATREEGGVRTIGDGGGLEAAVACVGFYQSGDSANFHRVIVRNLSMTGLYFVTPLPYRPGVRMEIQLALGPQVVHAAGTVTRVEQPAATVEGRLQGDCGCAVDFYFPLITPLTRLALMEFLIQQSQIPSWHDLPCLRTRLPRPHPPKNA